MNQLTVAARLTGGLGDVLMASPFLEKLYDSLGAPAITAYYHTPQAAAFVFSQARFVHAVGTHTDLLKLGRRSADLLVHTGHFPRYIVQNERTMRWAPEQFQQVRKLSDQRCASIAGLISQHPKLDGFWARMMAAKGQSYLDGMGWLSGLPVSRDSQPFLALDPAARLLPSASRRPYVTVHDGFDNRQLPKAGTATKCWPLKYWAALVKQLHELLPDYHVVQLGAGKSRPIPGVDVSLINGTSLAEAAWIVKEAALHIDTDSGIAHLARVVHTPAVVLFGPTNAAYFGHPENTNLTPVVCGDCWWSTPDWLSKCPRGLREPECMASIGVETVARAAVKQLAAVELASLSAGSVQLYTQPGDAIGLICDTLGLQQRPISEHIADPASGVYIHASKQWEYGYALDSIGEQLGAAAGLRIADIGGGRGALAPYLAKSGALVTQFDLDYQWGGNAATESNYRAWAREQGYAARFGSIYNLPVADSSYDVVLCISVLEHLPHKDAALRELLRILRPGGTLVLTFDFALEPKAIEDTMRVEVLSPTRLGELLGGAGIAVQLPSPDAVLKSALKIHADSVLGIPEGMTVAGLCISKTGIAATENGRPIEEQIAQLLAELPPDARDAALTMRRGVVG